MSRQIVSVIVNYGTADLAIEAVESLLAEGDAGPLAEIHVVDNASPGDDAARLDAVRRERGWGGRVTIHAETVNHGFGRGNNVVLDALARRDTPPEVVFLLNPDARVTPGALDTMLQAMDAAPDVGVVGAREVLPDGSPSAAAFRFPGLVSEVLFALALGPLTRLGRRWTLPLPEDQPEGPVDWVSGSALLIRWQALEETGFFDPAFFLYYEEVDLMRRMQAAGWQVLYVPRATVIHDVGAATALGRDGERRRRADYLYQSWRHYFTQSHGRAGALAIALAVTAAAGVERVVSAIVRRRPATPPHFFADQWRLVMKPLVTGRRPPETPR